MAVTASAVSISRLLANLSARSVSRQLTQFAARIYAFVWLVIVLFPPVASAEEQATYRQNVERPRYEEFLSDATFLGSGEVAAYRKGDRFLVELHAERLGRLVLWHAEAIEMPTEADEHNQIGTTVVSLERRGSIVLVRDRAPGLEKRAGSSRTDSEGGTSFPRPADLGVDPIYSAIAGNTSAPIMAAAPIVAEAPDGRLLIDVTKLFSSDIETLSAKKKAEFSKKRVKTVDSNRSYIREMRVFPRNLSVNSQLTFLVTDPASETADLVPVTVGVAHWFVTLPDQPMSARQFDERVGYFQTKFTEFGSAADDIYSKRGVIFRYRLEKADPTAAISDPIKPIVFYVGRGVPDRWRPYVRAGIEMWRPAFEAAGFRNAIVARDAPDPVADPNWAAEDAEINVVRWLPTNIPNAMGPIIYDPRSGEILGSHIQIFPRVATWASSYYYLMAKDLDPEVKSLPLGEEKLGELLTYIVAHEVGHALGLRHNHIASTAYSVSELRDPTFANSRGPNASIMAYGRMNQVAQPGDGVTRVLGGLGRYDYFAIKWGYGVHSARPTEEQSALDRMAANAATDTELRWASGEAPDEDRWRMDPRVLKENVGRERVEATRLGITKLASSLTSLASETRDDIILRETYDFALSLHSKFISSLGGLIGGTIVEPNGAIGHPDIEEQRNAIAYALGEGARSLDTFLQPVFVGRTYPAGATRRIAEARARIVDTFFNGQRLAAIEEQAVLRRVNYSLFEYADDVTKVIWDDLSVIPAWRRDLQDAYARAVEALLRPIDTAAQRSTKQRLVAEGYSENYALLVVTGGRDTAFFDWAREALPQLKSRLEAVAGTNQDRQVRAHLRQMAARLGALVDNCGSAPLDPRRPLVARDISAE
jgi:hypothetical protein